MWEAIIGTYLPLLVGASMTLITTLVLNERAHKRELENRKRERSIAAREIRLREGEEIVKILTGELFHLADVTKQILGAETKKDLDDAHEAVKKLQKMIDATEKGKNIYVISITSLGDDGLTKAWKKTSDSFGTYLNFSITLAGLLETDGIDLFLTEHDKFAKEDSELKKQYYGSAEKFFRRINELRSQ